MSTSDRDDLLDALADLRETGPGAEDLVARSLADAALTGARRAGPPEADLLMARTLRDADRVARARRRAEWVSWAGLAAACVAGLAVGLTDPAGLLGGAGYGLDALSAGYEFQIVEGTE